MSFLAIVGVVAIVLTVTGLSIFFPRTLFAIFAGVVFTLWFCGWWWFLFGPITVFSFIIDIAILAKIEP